MTYRIRGLALAWALVAVPAAAQPIGTAFTYQGRLTDAGNPASGSYDLQLALFDAATGGGQVGPTLTRDDVVVTSGLFTASLDFGTVFAGSKRWLELRVRPGASAGAYTTLLPRQELTPGPNAVFSAAVPWSGVSNKPAGFADDTDDDALGALSCPNGQIAKRVAGAWACASDNAHDHLAQSWTGSTANGLTITNAAGLALRGVSNGTAPTTAAIQGEISGTTGSGVFGLAPAATGFGTGVLGQSGSRDGIGVRGDATATIGTATGVAGNSTAPDGRGVVGGGTLGVAGLSSSTRGRGVWGIALASSGTTYGVHGETQSSAGYGGFFANASGGPAIGVSAGGIRFDDGTTQTTAGGDITAVNAGAGLTGGGTDGAVTLAAAFAGSGSATSVSRSDHDHVGQSWTGAAFASQVFRVTNTASGGFSDGILGVGEGAGQGRGVVGYATSPTGQNFGLWGQADSTEGSGVFGYVPAASGVTYGVRGTVESPDGRGVYGLASAAAGPGAGVVGQTNSSSGHGVQGIATATVGFTNGVFASIASPQGAAVRGIATTTNTVNVFGVFGSGNTAGVNGEGPTLGVRGFSPIEAVRGVTNGTTGSSFAIRGVTANPNAYAGYFEGRVNVTGTLTKGGGAFKIDHPLDPENRYLYHSFVESPDMKNIYDGVVTTDGDGFATVALPDWFEALNRDFRYQLTVIGRFAQAIVAREIEDNRFTIRTSEPSVKVSWQVTGIRHDAFAEKNRIPVEEDKPPEHRGKYAHPAEHGQPREKGVGWLDDPDLTNVPEPRSP